MANATVSVSETIVPGEVRLTAGDNVPVEQ